MYSDFEYPLQIALWCLFGTAIWHQFVGVSGLIWAPRGGYTVPLLVLFIAAGLAAFALQGLILFNFSDPTRLYALASVLMVIFLIAWADVHVIGLAEAITPFALTFGEGTGTVVSGGADFGILVPNLINDPAALVSKAAEAIAAVVFGAYAIMNYRARGDE